MNVFPRFYWLGFALATCFSSYASAQTTDKTAAKNKERGMSVFGNQEQPKVLHIVPWKSVHQEVATNQYYPALADVIRPVEQEVFNREARYWQQINTKPDNQTLENTTPENTTLENK